VKKDLHLLISQGRNGDVIAADCTKGQSDSACLDNMIELLTLYRPLIAACDDDADP
jgi:hypothetical protein